MPPDLQPRRPVSGGHLVRLTALLGVDGFVRGALAGGGMLLVAYLLSPERAFVKLGGDNGLTGVLGVMCLCGITFGLAGIMAAFVIHRVGWDAVLASPLSIRVRVLLGLGLWAGCMVPITVIRMVEGTALTAKSLIVPAMFGFMAVSWSRQEPGRIRKVISRFGGRTLRDALL